MPDSLGRVVIVNATDAAKALDRTCLVEPGEHEAITKPSVIYYDDAQFRDLDAFLRRLKAKTIRPAELASDELMKRIRQGALDSLHTPREIRAAIRRCPWVAGGSQSF